METYIALTEHITFDQPVSPGEDSFTSNPTTVYAVMDADGTVLFVSLDEDEVNNYPTGF